MILTDATALSERANDLRRRQQIAHVAEAWGTHEEVLKEFGVRLQVAAEFITWVQNRSIAVVGADVAAKKKAKQTMTGLLKKIANEPEEVFAPGYMPTVRADLESFIGGEEERAHAAWEQLGNSLEWARADLWQPFATSSKYRSIVEKAASQDRQLDALLKKSFLKTAAEREEFDDLLLAGHKLRQTLPSIDSGEVQEFMSAVSMQGARLALLTPEVIEWLKTHGLIDNYVVRRQQLGGR